MNRRAILKYVGLSAIAVAIVEAVIFVKGTLGSAAASATLGDAAFDQVGFLPAGDKVATLPAHDMANQAFQIYSEQTKQPVFHGTLTATAVDAASGDRVAQADFSQWTIPGVYRLVAQGKTSQPFSIGKDVYREPLRLSMRAFYGQRCGCAVDLGDGYRHPACHSAGAYHATSGREGTVRNHGGWHDAGDYGRYIVNSGITTGTLLWAWELYPQALRALSLSIPESGGKLPDYLAEIRWNLEWMLSLQDDDGGVWHKQTSEQFCGFIMPEKDTLTSYIIGTGTSPYKSTCATADFAAVMAIAARCYGAYDSEFSARCLAAAQSAWSWALAHPDVTFSNPPGIGTGAYDDKTCNDEVLWASAELWRTTGDPQYERAFLAGTDLAPPETAIDAPSWDSVAPLAYWTYALTDRTKAASTDADTPNARILRQTQTSAQTLIARRKTSGYGNTLASTDYVWGSNAIVANQSLLLLIAHRLQPDPHTLEAALGNLHYLLGRNCFGVSWVTHVGTNPFQNPHHRPSAADHIPAPWPGLLSGGPNAKPGDMIAHTLPKLPPMHMWADNEMAYSLNEIAINWNAPLVFLLAGANALAL